MQWSNNQRQAPLEISYQTVEMHKKKFCWNPQAVGLLVFGESFQGICICIRTQMVGLLVISRWFKGYVFLIRKLLCRCYRSLQLALPGFPRFWAKSPPSSPTRPLSALFLFRTSVKLAWLSPSTATHKFMYLYWYCFCIFVSQSAFGDVCFFHDFSRHNRQSTIYENMTFVRLYSLNMINLKRSLQSQCFFTEADRDARQRF